jgi:hypothetical protein
MQHAAAALHMYNTSVAALALPYLLQPYWGLVSVEGRENAVSGKAVVTLRYAAQCEGRPI